MEFTFSRTAALARARDFIGKSVERGTFPQALLTYGIRGTGHPALLLDTAEILLCESPIARPCGACKYCTEVKHRNRDNIHCILPIPEPVQKKRDSRQEAGYEALERLRKDPYGYFPLKREYISIDQVRDLKERLGFSETSTRRRIVIIFWSETMPDPAANALLKILEEPPSGTFFLLGCENRIILLPTILSRCVQLNLSALTLQEMQIFASARSSSNAAREQALLPFCGGSPGTFVEACTQDGTERLSVAALMLKCILHKDWFAYSAFLEKHSEFNDMEKTLTVLKFAHEMIRIGFLLSTGTAAAHQGCEALFSRGFPESSGLFTELSQSPDIPHINQYLNDVTSAVSHYAHPKTALAGYFMELAA